MLSRKKLLAEDLESLKSRLVCVDIGAVFLENVKQTQQNDSG